MKVSTTKALIIYKKEKLLPYTSVIERMKPLMHLYNHLMYRMQQLIEIEKQKRDTVTDLPKEF